MSLSKNVIKNQNQHKRRFLIGAYRQKVKDSEIAVSVNVNDIRKELLDKIENGEQYHFLYSVLRLNVNQKYGLSLSSSPYNRFAIENALLRLENCSEAIEKLKLVDDTRGDYSLNNNLEFLNSIKVIKRQTRNDEILNKFMYYLQKVISLEYKHLKHIPKRRYYNPAADINATRQCLLREIKNKHQYDNMNIVLRIPVERNKGIGLSSNEISNTACLNILSNVLNNLEIKNYLDDVISQQNDKNTSFHELLKFLKSQESQQNDPINKDFLGYIIRVVEIEYKGLNQPLKEKVKTTDQLDVEKTLFPEGSPKIDDIKQGHIGDCYLLAALMSIIKKDPKYITNCFPEKSNYNINQKAVKVRLYNIKVKLTKIDDDFVFDVSPTGVIIIEVDNTILMKRQKVKSSGKYSCVSTLSPFGNTTRALWVNFMEKAFSVYKNISGVVTADGKEAEDFIKMWEKSSDHSISGQNVNGGWEFMPFSIITGKKSKSIPITRITSYSEAETQKIINNFTFSGEYTQKENNVFDYIGDRIKRGESLTAGTKTNIAKNASENGIVSSHAYSIQGTHIYNGKKYIILKNPHMKQTLNDPISGEELDTGTIKLEFKEFIKYFKDINEVDLK